MNDIDSRFLIEVLSHKFGNKYFELRPSAAYDLMAMLYMQEVDVGRPHDVLVSLPLFCKMSGMSINEIHFKNYVAKLKPEYNNVELCIIWHMITTQSMLVTEIKVARKIQS